MAEKVGEEERKERERAQADQVSTARDISVQLHNLAGCLAGWQLITGLAGRLDQISYVSMMYICTAQRVRKL